MDVVRDGPVGLSVPKPRKARATHHPVVEVLLEDQRVDGNVGFLAGDTGAPPLGPLEAAVGPLIKSMDALGSGGTEDIMRSLVLLLASRRVNRQQLDYVLQKFKAC